MATLLAAGPAHAEETWAGHTFYLGDMHAHTGASGDGGSTDLGTCAADCGAVTDMIAVAKDNDLSYVAFPDHTNGDFAASDDDYATVLAEVMAGHDPAGGFVTIPAAELKLEYVDGADMGHKNLYFFSEDDALLSTLTRSELIPTTSLPDSRVSSCSAWWQWVVDLSTTYGELIAIPHHTSANVPMPTDWNCHNDFWEPVTEVYSVHGNGMGTEPDFDPMFHGERTNGTTHAALDETNWGLRLGFIAGSDGHTTRPGGVCDLAGPAGDPVPYGGGLSIAVLDESEPLSRSALASAFVERRVYGTSGPLLPVTVDWSSLGTSLGGLGDVITVPAGLGLRVMVQIRPRDAAHVTQVVVVDDSLRETVLFNPLPGVFVANYPTATVPEWAYVRVDIDGDRWWGPGACEDGGDSAEERVWLSPTWFD